jgi:hypothetical protein
MKSRKRLTVVIYQMILGTFSDELLFVVYRLLRRFKRLFLLFGVIARLAGGQTK